MNRFRVNNRKPKDMPSQPVIAHRSTLTEMTKGRHRRHEDRRRKHTDQRVRRDIQSQLE